MAKCTNGRRGRPKMVGYARCKGCGIADVEYHRQRLKLRLSGHLYVAHTPHGLKVDRSRKPDQRVGVLKHTMFGGGDVTLLRVYDDIGHLEPFVHFELNDYRTPDRREVFDCDLETVQASIDRVIAARVE